MDSVNLLHEQKPWNMNNIRSGFAAIAFAVSIVTYPQVLPAQGFDGDQFLAWSRSAQDSYIQTSITMAAIIATKTRPAAGDCIDAWYLSPDANRTSRNDEIRGTIGRNSEFHPSAVIFLVLEQNCGPFS